MSYDVFVSHSSKDVLAADEIVSQLEFAGLRCWVAPRDIVPGESWATSIVKGINESKLMVVIFSSNANHSDHVRREVERAVFRGVKIIPIRIEDVLPQGDLEYFLSASHWMEASLQPLEQHAKEFAITISGLLNVVPKAFIPTTDSLLISDGPASPTNTGELLQVDSQASNIGYSEDEPLGYVQRIKEPSTCNDQAEIAADDPGTISAFGFVQATFETLQKNNLGAHVAFLSFLIVIGLLSYYFLGNGALCILFFVLPVALLIFYWAMQTPETGFMRLETACVNDSIRINGILQDVETLGSSIEMSPGHYDLLIVRNRVVIVDVGFEVKKYTMTVITHEY